MISNLWNFFPFSINMDYHMKFLKFLSLLQKRGLSDAIFGISFLSQKRGLSYAVLEFLTLLQIPRLSYAFYGISFPSPKMWTIICIFLNFFPFPINVDYQMPFLEFLSLLRNVDYHMQFLKFHPLLQKRGLLYAIFGIYFPSQKMWTSI